MGFLKNLFAKKDCEICGGDIGLLGNTKLADGDLCKDCKEKLSPFYHVSDDTTVADIKEHLAYREENKKALEEFNPDEIFGAADQICVDTAARKFVFARNGDWKETEADVIDFSHVTKIYGEIEDDEIYPDSDNEDEDEDSGEEVVVEPFTVSHFNVTILVDIPFIQEIEICLSEGETPCRDGDEKEIAQYNQFNESMNCLCELLAPQE